MGFIPYLTKTMKAYPEIIPVVGITALAVGMGTFAMTRNYNWNRVQWTAGEPALHRRPDQNTKFINNQPITGGKSMLD